MSMSRRAPRCSASAIAPPGSRPYRQKPQQLRLVPRQSSHRSRLCSRESFLKRRRKGPNQCGMRRCIRWPQAYWTSTRLLQRSTPMASRWPVPRKKERGDVLLSSGPARFFRWIYGGACALFAVLFAVTLVMINLFGDPSSGAEHAVQAVVFGGFILFFVFGFLLFTKQGVWATREGILMRSLPSTGKFLPWSEINSLEPGQLIGKRLRTLVAHTAGAKASRSPCTTNGARPQRGSPRTSHPRAPASLAPTRIPQWCSPSCLNFSGTVEAKSSAGRGLDQPTDCASYFRETKFRSE